VQTIEAAIKTDSDCLSGMKRKSKDETLILVMLMLEQMLQFFNVGNQMNAEQQKQTAILIINEFYWLKPVDLEYFFRRLKTGFYGELYNRIDGNVIMAKLREYCEERTQKGIELSLLAHKQVNEPIADKVVIFLGEGYLRVNGVFYDEVLEKELATVFDYATALRTKAKVSQFENVQADKVKIETTGTKIGLMDYIATNKPHLLPKDEAYKRATKEYFAAKQAIESDSTLSPEERHEKLLELAKQYVPK